MSDDLLRDLFSTFAVEAREHLQTISRGLIELERTEERARREPLLAELFRAAHSLKGAARAVGAEEVEGLAHDLETQFDMLRSGDLNSDGGVVDALYRRLDEMSEGVERTLGGGAPTAAPPPATQAGLDAPGEGLRQPPVERPEAPQRPEPPAPPSTARSEDTVRVATSKLDTLVAQVGEMHVAQAESEQHGLDLSEVLDEIAALEASWRKAQPQEHRDGHTRLREIRERLGRLEGAVRAGSRRRAQLTSDLQDDVRRIRMLPVSTVLDAFPRMVRDLAREQRKEIDLILEGAATEVDRFVLEQIKDPLTHLLRNSVDHGIEKPAERVASGKPPGGTVTLTASQRGDRLVLEIADDGAGIDAAAVKAAAVSRGALSQDEARALDDRDALWLIFRSSVSTSPIVTDLSGRGVGMDVVHDAVERLQGTIDVESRPGEGSRFILTLPLAVAARRCLLVQAGIQVFGVPATGVLRIVRLRREELGRAGGQDAVNLDGEPVAMTHLSTVLGLDEGGGALASAGDRIAVVVGSAGRRAALVVDGLRGEQDAVIKPLPKPFVRVPGTAGATTLGTGEVVLILSVVDLLRAAGRTRATTRPGPGTDLAVTTPTLLVVDDSITTRTMEKNILEAAGFRVRVASDGLDAWRLLQQGDVQLLVSDVAMPGLDGFELTEKVRAHKRLKDLPVILVTSLASDEHRERGIEVGADAYIVKSAFDQDRLLETVRRLI